MIAYTTVGANDIEKSTAFYDALFSSIGISRLWSDGSFFGYGASMDTPMFAVTKPHNGEAATAGNGTMIAIAVESPEQVSQLHAKAMELGAVDEGAPGPRGEAGQFYCGYFRDPDGNKLNAFCFNQG